MQFLKRNKWLFILFLLPFFFFYLDSLYITTIKNIYHHSPQIEKIVDYPDKVIGLLSNGFFLLIVSCLIYIIGYLMKNRMAELGKLLFIGFWSTGIIIQVLKHLIGRARPKFADSFMCIGPNLKTGFDSFPSGHTAIAFCFATILSSYFPRYRFIFYIFSAIAGLERTESFSHFLSDVIAGAIIGILIGKAIIKYTKKENSLVFLNILKDKAQKY